MLSANLGYHDVVTSLHKLRSGDQRSGEAWHKIHARQVNINSIDADSANANTSGSECARDATNTNRARAHKAAKDWAITCHVMAGARVNNTGTERNTLITLGSHCGVGRVFFWRDIPIANTKGCGKIYWKVWYFAVNYLQWSVFFTGECIFVVGALFCNL
jgi:hypothetical protein